MQNPSASHETDTDTLPGFFFALGAYLLWGFLPLYMKALAHVPPVEIVSHRVLWSIPVAGLVLIATRRTSDLMLALRTPRMIAMAVVTALLISVNWAIYIWSIGSGHALDAALGYYINPLFSVFLGAVFLRERLARPQWAAIGLAAIAVVIITVMAGKLPLVSLGLTLSWGIYAFLKKKLPIGPNQGFMLEILILTPAALVYVIFLEATGQGHFLGGTMSDSVLLAGCGLITAVPLMLYANGAKLLRLSTIAIMQYIAPSMIFLTAALIFAEPVGLARMVAFPLIWAALAIYSVSLFRGKKRPDPNRDLRQT